MTAWQNDELQTFTAAQELHVSPLRDDGASCFKPIPIWAVAVDDALYARAYYGQTSRWYQAALRQRTGRITAAGLTKDVTFEPAGSVLDGCIDEAYRAKYASSPYLAAMIAADARATTLRIQPRA